MPNGSVGLQVGADARDRRDAVFGRAGDLRLLPIDSCRTVVSSSPIAATVGISATTG